MTIPAKVRWASLTLAVTLVTAGVAGTSTPAAVGGDASSACAVADARSGAAVGCGTHLLPLGLPASEVLAPKLGLGAGYTGRSSGPGADNLHVAPGGIVGQVVVQQARLGAAIARPPFLTGLIESGKADLPPPLSWL